MSCSVGGCEWGSEGFAVAVRVDLQGGDGFTKSWNDATQSRRCFRNFVALTRRTKGVAGAKRLGRVTVMVGQSIRGLTRRSQGIPKLIGVEGWSLVRGRVSERSSPFANVSFASVAWVTWPPEEG